MTIDTSGWTRIGQTSNAELYEIEPRILAVVPFDGTSDDEHTARESVRLQLEHLRGHGLRAGVVVFVDRVADQSAAARTVYRDEPDPAFQACFALVGGTPFGRAVGSVFIGLNRPKVPTKLFSTFDAALAWAREKVRGE